MFDERKKAVGIFPKNLSNFSRVKRGLENFSKFHRRTKLRRIIGNCKGKSKQNVFKHFLEKKNFITEQNFLWINYARRENKSEEYE